MSKYICIPNFDEISQSTAELLLGTTSGFYGRSPYWNSTSGFKFDLFIIMGMAFCIRVPNFIQIGQRTAELWRHVNILRWRPAAMLDFGCIIFDHARSTTVGPSLFYNYGVDLIYSFGDIAIVRFLAFAFKLPIHVVTSAALRRINSKFTSGVETIHTFVFVGVDLPASIFRISFSNNGCFTRDVLHVKAFLGRNFQSCQNCPQNFLFKEIVKIAKFYFGTPKGTFWRETTSFDVLIVKIGAAGLHVYGVARTKQTDWVTSVHRFARGEGVLRLWNRVQFCLFNICGFIT